MTAGELVVKVEADTRGFAAGMAEAAAETKAFGEEAKSSTDSSSRLGRVMGSLGSMAGFLAKHWIITTGAVIGLIGPMTQLASAFGMSLPLVSGLSAALVFLIQPLTTLAAIIVGFIAPLTTFVGLLGLLGGAFFLAGRTALTSKTGFGAFQRSVDSLQGQFAALGRTLANDFMPIFWQLQSAAHIALNYFDQLAHMPLNEAFHSLATKGVRMLADFLNQVGHVVANPIRLAIKVAFSTNAMSTALQHIVNQVSGFLTGETVNIPIGVQARHRGGATTRNVAGALDPIEKWFDGHSKFFSATGKRWGNELGTTMGKAIGQTVIPAMIGSLGHGFARIAGLFLDNFSTSGRTAKELNSDLQAMAGNIVHWLGHAFSTVWNDAIHGAGTFLSNVGGKWATEFNRWGTEGMKDFSSMLNRWSGDLNGWIATAATSLVTGIMGAWNTILNGIRGIWNQVVSLIESPLHISISWPSPPSWLSHLPGSSLFGSAFGAITGSSAAGHIVTRPQVRRVGESGAEAIIPLTGSPGRNALAALGGGGGDIHIHLNGATFLSGGRPAARELARVLKPELERIVTAR